MARLLTVASVIFLTVGVIIGWPFIRASMQYRAVRGQIIDVFTLPFDDHQVKLFIAYEYPLPGPERHRALGALRRPPRNQCAYRSRSIGRRTS